jgi:hypothetical protein
MAAAQATSTKDPETADALRRMADQYLAKAKELSDEAPSETEKNRGGPQS